MNRNHHAYVFLFLAAAALSGCGNSGGRPLAPALSATIVDRMGRAGVNTALTDPFDTDLVREDGIKDTYNSASNPALWAGAFSTMIAGNLAILDSLDENCGNQLLAGTTLNATRYNALAGILADDQLYVNTASGICSQYLAVEANAAGVVPNSDCGGRTPLYDTIDTTYSVLALGALAGVDDGVNSDADGAASLSTFPFLDTAI
jgi:hypothetical protein